MEIISNFFNAPCMGCAERTPTCHGACERYNVWRVKTAEMRRRAYEADHITDCFSTYHEMQLEMRSRKK